MRWDFSNAHIFMLYSLAFSGVSHGPRAAAILR
jgi:hypothetical protein